VLGLVLLPLCAEEAVRVPLEPFEAFEPGEAALGFAGLVFLLALSALFEGPAEGDWADFPWEFLAVAFERPSCAGPRLLGVDGSVDWEG